MSDISKESYLSVEESDGTVTYLLGDNIILKVNKFGKVLLRIANKLIEKGYVEYYGDICYWLFLISIDGANARTRFVVQVLGSLSPKNGEFNETKFNSSSKMYFTTPQLFAIANMKETAENMEKMFPYLQEEINNLAGKVFEDTESATKHQFTIGKF